MKEIDRLKEEAYMRGLGVIKYLRSKKDCRAWLISANFAPCWVLINNGAVVAITIDNIKSYFQKQQ